MATTAAQESYKALFPLWSLVGFSPSTFYCHFPPKDLVFLVFA